ncbi:alpha-N-arabinofuranosidase [Microbacterium sp. cf332]|uniref:arabinosylfuranosidase ArfA n=1 Tax=Microbacterium sp. cf332 TaxID=1761804 RepID=UPI000889608E|nr:alpha-N-arabinofuranosidase [Microbacterium sp. cf332]SDQ29814.1 alpha-N-arabinofuranosidase [Microbacterium sp. cf332]
MTPTNAAIDPRFEISRIDRRIFGGFVEHLGRHIYDGIHEPGHPAADADGFRADVVELVRELGVSTIRYPGGNFVSGYRWEDGVGPHDERPRRLDLAWHSTETNEVGLHEFARWLELVGSDLMLAVNLGTRGTQEAIDLLEYVNSDADTSWTRQRAANGRRDPFAVRMWCLGNEMDGPWQLGHRNADDYGKLASRTAKAMRMLDPDIELVVCGSSGSGMPTFGSWERTVLEHTFDDVDFISCHSYYQERFGNAQEFLASGVDMSRFIASVVSIADAVAATKKSDKRIMISFDEWNVWYLHNDEGGQDDKPREPGWPVAPRLLEDRYSALDAVVFGDLLITLLQHSDRVRSASLAQLVNVIAPVMTEPGGPAWRQTTFHPFSLTSRLAGERAISVPVLSGSFESERFGTVPNVNAVATVDDAGATLFVVNRSTGDGEDLRIDVSALAAAGAGVSVIESHLLHDDDRYAANTLDEPERVGVVPVPGISVEDGVLSLSLPPISWAAVRLG